MGRPRQSWVRRVRPELPGTWVVVLAGGDGRRLAGLAKSGDGRAIPKQFCSLTGGPSLVQLALRRALAVTSQDRVVCVVNEAHRQWWEPQFRGLRHKIVVQPGNRGTGLGVLLPLLVIAKNDAHGGVLCLPSDHYIEHEDVLAESLRQLTAAEVYESGKVTLLGVSPHSADAGFGYLLPDALCGPGVRPVRDFIEKPDESAARELMERGALWSSGIFAGSIARLIEFFPRTEPGMMLDLKSIVEYWGDTSHPSAELASIYTRHACLDFSRDVLQQLANRVQMLELPPCGWSDVGTPERLAHTLASLKLSRVDALNGRAGETFNLARALKRFYDVPAQSNALQPDQHRPRSA